MRVLAKFFAWNPPTPNVQSLASSPLALVTCTVRAVTVTVVDVALPASATDEATRAPARPGSGWRRMPGGL
jgi:hypothetical protein